MKYNFNKASEKRRGIQSQFIKHGKFAHDSDVLLQLIILGAISHNPETAREFKGMEGYNPKELDVRMTVNGIEIDLEKGLNRLEQVLNGK